MRVKYNADTEIVFQIGDPVEYSCAAFLHNAMYEYANINAVSLIMHVDKGRLEEFVSAAKFMRINGFDLTMPHKTDIIPFLDECDEVSRIFKCVNHVKIKDGRLIGRGLDGVGMRLAIEDKTGPVSGKSVLIMGAGAVAGAIAAELCAHGAREVTIANRTESKAEYIAEKMKAMFQVPVDIGPLSDEYMSSVAGGIDVVVQCTSLGPMLGHEDFTSLSFVDRLRPGCVVADVLYPTTTLLDKVAALGLDTVDGSGMMYFQQFPAMEFRFGIKLLPEAVLEAEEAVALAVTMRDLRNKRKKRVKL